MATPKGTRDKYSDQVALGTHCHANKDHGEHYRCGRGEAGGKQEKPNTRQAHAYRRDQLPGQTIDRGTGRERRPAGDVDI